MASLRIKLTREEMAECEQAASLRWQLARAAGVKNQRKAEKGDDDVDFLGIRAEMAVAKAYGLNFNPFALGIDNGEDLFAGDIGIDVKSTFHMSGMLMFKSVEAFRADIGVLVTGTEEPDVMQIVGWVTRSRFQEECERQEMGKGQGKAATLGQGRLSSPDSLWRYITSQKFAA